MEKIGTMVTLSKEREKKFAGLIDTYEKLVFSICYKITGDYFAAEDLSQETFLSVFQKYDTFDGVNEKAWICRIATNKSIDYMRNSGRRSTPTEDVFFETLPDEKKNPEKNLIEQEIKERFRELCKGLKPPYDEIAEDYYIKEQSVAEIAKKKGVGTKTIQTRVYRARNMLRSLYGKEESG